MIINEEKALERLYSPDNLVNIRKMSGSTERHSQLEKQLAVETAILTSGVEAAEAFGMTPENVSYLKNHGKSIDQDKLKTNLQTAHSAALDIMMDSLDALKPKIRDVKKATDLAKIAAEMGRAIEKTSPKEAATTNVKVVVFAPNLKEEEIYETIEVTS